MSVKPSVQPKRAILQALTSYQENKISKAVISLTRQIKKCIPADKSHLMPSDYYRKHSMAVLEQRRRNENKHQDRATLSSTSRYCQSSYVSDEQALSSPSKEMLYGK